MCCSAASRIRRVPDVIICVVDASNLERNLYLVAQMLELNIPIVVALNMVDVAKRTGWSSTSWRCAKGSACR
ncbi:MAG: FeoB small GTPase domain-containing protein [Chthoniobacter sp.]